jgi:hypothetical protein
VERDLDVHADCANHVDCAEAAKVRKWLRTSVVNTYPNAIEAGMPRIGRLTNDLSIKL